MISHADRIASWVRRNFGSRVLLDPKERASRVVEEAIELAQAEGLALETVDAIARRVYSRPRGHAPQEASGVGLTLLAWCWARGHNLELLMDRELDRIEAVDPDLLRAKHWEKVHDGASLIPPEKR